MTNQMYTRDYQLVVTWLKHIFHHSIVQTTFNYGPNGT